MRHLGLWFGRENFTEPNLFHDGHPEEKFSMAITSKKKSEIYFFIDGASPFINPGQCSHDAEKRQTPKSY